MPSWQNALLSFAIKSRLKRRPSDEMHHNVKRARSILSQMPGFATPPHHHHVSVHTHEDHHPIRGEWLKWKKKEHHSDKVLYFLHGGGYMACSTMTHRPLTVGLTQALRSDTFAIDYRLAPEHPFPAAVEDALAGYEWLLEQGVSHKKMIIAGDSAGGGLTLATMLAARDRGLPLPAASVCYSPWTDLAATGDSLHTNDPHDVMFYGESIRKGRHIYLGQAPPTNPLASPLYADLTGLPPLLLFASSTEVLLDDSTRLAHRAQAAGVHVDLQVWHGLPHAWPIFHRLLPEGKKAVHYTAEFVKRHVV